jgi:hypothetical protein
MAKKFMYGVGVLKFKDKVLGYILKGSFQLNGSKGEVSKIYAEQVQSAPVKTLPGSNGTIAPSFNLIELDYEVMKELLGGTLVTGADGKVTGWNAPSDVIVLEGEFIIETVSGQRITIFNGLLQGNLGGNLEMTTLAQIEVAIEVQLSTDPDQPPYRVEDIVEV